MLVDPGSFMFMPQVTLRLPSAKPSTSRFPTGRIEADKNRASFDDPPVVDALALASAGQPLERTTRKDFEKRFGHDFSGVRVHSDAQSAVAAERLGAEAFTVGRNILFGRGMYEPESQSGRRRIAHELTHVVQQRSRVIDASQVEPQASPAEREADIVATAVGVGRVFSAPNALPRGIPRDVGWARRGPIPDPYGMGFNEIFNRAGALSHRAVLDLSSLTARSLGVDIAAFDALPSNRAIDVLLLERHASGTACEPWFAVLRSRTITLTDPYSMPGGGPSAVRAHFFRGQTNRRALLIGGVHNLTEPQGERVIAGLRTLLTHRAAAGRLPYFTTILVPTLFDRSRYHSRQGAGRWVTGGTGRNIAGGQETTRPVEPNRNFPLPGEGLETARGRGAGSSSGAELAYRDPGSPSAAPRAPQDMPGPGRQGTSTRMLAETRALIALVEHFQPERIASVHAHSLKITPGDAPGIFVDPRGVDPTTNVTTNAALANQDDRLAAAMVIEGRNRLATGPIPGRPSDPFVGDAPGTGRRPRYSSGVHAEGSSLGTWAPQPVAGRGARAGIATVTVEVPQWADPANAAALQRIEELHRDLLADIFLGDPGAVTPSTAPTAP